MKRILMIAFHFPPLAGSSGIQRTLRMVSHLPDLGWQPIVLTANPRAYGRCSNDQLQDIPGHVPVIRAQAWDTARHFSAFGRYPAALGRPDRWVSWWPGAVLAGRRAIRAHKPDVIWSTYPIATAHSIGSTLAKQSGLPWVADFRDPMAQPNYPKDPLTWRQFSAIERKTITTARLCTFTTPSAAATYRERYPEASERIRLLENGYDEESFAGAQPLGSLNEGKLTLLHSGIVYPSERDPTCLFAALADLKSATPKLFEKLIVRFRAPVHTDLIQNLATQHGVSQNTEVLPSVNYRDALSEMLSADGLLLLQASNCNEQIPVKLYEYLRAGRPIIALTDHNGDTGKTLLSAGVDSIASLDNPGEIHQLLGNFVAHPEMFKMPSGASIQSSSRTMRASQLVRMLEEFPEDACDLRTNAS